MASTPLPKPRKIITITSSNCSSFIVKSLVSRLLNLSPNLTIHVADPHPQTVALSDRILHFQTRFEDVHQLRSAIDGSSSVFHVDSTIGIWSTAADDWWRYYKEIVEGTRNVIRVCRECGVERLVYTGTADVVFDGMREIVGGDESMPYPAKFLDVMNDLRVQAEMLVLSANGRDGLSTCVLRATNPFGPDDDNFIPVLLGKAKSAWAKVDLSDILCHQPLARCSPLVCMLSSHLSYAFSLRQQSCSTIEVSNGHASPNLTLWHWYVCVRRVGHEYTSLWG